MALLFLLLAVFAQPSYGDVLRYAIRLDPFEVQLTLPDGTKQTTRPRRETTHFHCLAEDGWPVPEGPDAKRVRCEIRWNGLPAGWRLVNSFGIDRRVQQFETTLGDLRKAVFAGGDFRVARSRKGLLWVTRDTWRFSDVEAVDLLDRVAEAQTALWRDRGLAGHVVYLLATDKPAGHWEGGANPCHGVAGVSRYGKTGGRGPGAGP